MASSPSLESPLVQYTRDNISPLPSWSSSPSFPNLSAMSSRNTSTDYFGSRQNLMVAHSSPNSPPRDQTGAHTGLATPPVELLLNRMGSFAHVQEPPSLIGEPEFHPRNWALRRRWTVTILIALQTFVLSFGSAAYTGGLEQMMYFFEVNEKIALLGLSLYVLGFGLGPFVWSPLSEVYGRRPTFLASYALFIAFNVGAAFSQTMTQMAVFRCLAGMAGSSPLTNGGAVLSDMWADKDRAMPAVSFAVTVFLGPVLSPIVSGYMAEYTSSWRNIFYLQIASSAVIFLVSAAVMPETFYPLIARQKGLPCVDKVAGGGMLGAIKRPIAMLATEVICLFLAIWISVCYGTLYLMFAAYPVVFELGRGWDIGKGSLPFLGIGAGMLLIFPSQLVSQRRYDATLTRDGFVLPEFRLLGPMLGAILMPISLIGFAWTSQPEIHWIAPTLFGVGFGTAMMWIFLGSLAYMLDTYDPSVASAALASNAIVRSFVAACFPEFCPTLFTNLSSSWAMTIVCGMSVLCAPLPFLLKRYGAVLRARSPLTKQFPTVEPPPAVPKPLKEKDLREKAQMIALQC